MFSSLSLLFTYIIQATIFLINSLAMLASFANKWVKTIILSWLRLVEQFIQPPPAFLFSGYLYIFWLTWNCSYSFYKHMGVMEFLQTVHGMFIDSQNLLFELCDWSHKPPVIAAVPWLDDLTSRTFSPNEFCFLIEEIFTIYPIFNICKVLCKLNFGHANIHTQQQIGVHEQAKSKLGFLFGWTILEKIFYYFTSSNIYNPKFLIKAR